METRCPSCSTLIPHRARYCPKCGQLAPPPGPDKPARAPDAHPATAPIPRAGKAFLLAGLFGLGLLIAGFVTQNPKLIFVGAGIVGVLILMVVAGDMLS